MFSVTQKNLKVFRGGKNLEFEFLQSFAKIRNFQTLQEVCCKEPRGARTISGREGQEESLQGRTGRGKKECNEDCNLVLGGLSSSLSAKFLLCKNPRHLIDGFAVELNKSMQSGRNLQF